MSKQNLLARSEALSGILLGAAGLSVFGVAPLTAESAGNASDLKAPAGSIHDYDYYQFGRWTAVQRRMKKRWTNHPEWETFPSTDIYSRYLDGLVSVDQIVFPTKGWSGLTIRTFNRDRRQWFTYWVDNRDGVMGTPVIGGYKGNIGTYYGDDTDDGVPIKVVNIETKLPPDKARWEQAFSRDGGKTWETNWTADFTRVR